MIGRAVLLIAALAQAGAAQAGGRLPVRVTSSVSPDTVAVGEPATLTVRVMAPRGATLVFPEAVDSTGAVEPLDPVVVRAPDAADSAYVATYRLLAWRPGATSIPMAAIRYDDGSGMQVVEVPSTRLVVSTILPPDTALRVPRAARPILAAPRNLLPWYLGALALAALVALVVWLTRRRRRELARPRDPYADAQRAFARLAALDLIGAGEPARHVSATADVVREYFAARDAQASRGLTTDELIAVLADDPDVPVRRVEALFRSCDVVKFAPASADARTAESIASEAEAIVRETHRASRPPEDATGKRRTRAHAEVA